MRKLVVILAKLQIERLPQNLQVFAYVLVLLPRFRPLQLRESRLKFLALHNLIRARRICNQRIVLHQPLVRTTLRGMFQLNIQQHLRVLVAAHYPGWLRRGNRSNRRSARSLRSHTCTVEHHGRSKEHRQNGSTAHRQISMEIEYIQNTTEAHTPSCAATRPRYGCG